MREENAVVWRGIVGCYGHLTGKFGEGTANEGGIKWSVSLCVTKLVKTHVGRGKVTAKQSLFSYVNYMSTMHKKSPQTIRICGLIIRYLGF